MIGCATASIGLTVSPTRRVSEGFCGIVHPSLTLRVMMFPLPAAKLLKQQALTLRVGMNKPAACAKTTLLP